MFYKYPETVGLEKRREILAVKEVVATEKLHGTNFRIYFPAGIPSIAEVQYGGRNEEFGSDGGADFYSGKPVRWFKERPELLERMLNLFRERGFGSVVVYGEMCGTGIQKGVRYVSTDHVLFRAFDIRIGESFVSYDGFAAICDQVGLPRVPEVWRGDPSLEAFNALLDRPSLEGQANGVAGDTNVMEGVVIRSNPLLRNVFGEWLIIKHKSERFAEIAKVKIRSEQRDLTPVETFAQNYVLLGRVINAVGRLRDVNAPLVGDMQDMPHLVKAMVEDLQKECGPEWTALNEQGFEDKVIRSAVSKTLARLYRRMLLEDAASG